VTRHDYLKLEYKMLVGSQTRPTRKLPMSGHSPTYSEVTMSGHSPDLSKVTMSVTDPTYSELFLRSALAPSTSSLAFRY